LKELPPFELMQHLSADQTGLRLVHVVCLPVIFNQCVRAVKKMQFFEFHCRQTPALHFFLSNFRQIRLSHIPKLSNSLFCLEMIEVRKLKEAKAKIYGHGLVKFDQCSIKILYFCLVF